jgi:CIC family chloride channel protein
VLSLLDIRKLIEKNFKTVHPEATLAELIECIKVSSRNIFPVVDSECELVGVIHLDDIRHMMFDREKHSTVTIKTIMKIPDTVLNKNDDMETVMWKFERSGKWNLPVVDQGQYVGFISKSSIFSAYRQKLRRQHREEL